VIAEDDRNMIGFASCGLQRDKDLIDAGFSGEFGAIYVLRSHQERGIGRSLMAATAKELSEAGHAAASLWVLRENEPARAFYDKLGGVIVAQKLDEQAGMILIEDAYGWRDLSRLAG
jgi:ribosomal protein S18 acetylase RimI-like enzyme